MLRYILAFALIALAGDAQADQPIPKFTVENLTTGTAPKFTVQNLTTTAVPGGTAKIPFSPGGITKDTIAPSAARPALPGPGRGSNGGTIPAAVTTTDAPLMGLSGGISGCANGQCASPSAGFFGRRRR